MVNNKVVLSNGTALIDLSQDTVTSAGDIASGKTGHLADGTSVTGTFTADANATSADIASGKTAYVNGSKITGTASGGAVDYNITISASSPTGGNNGDIWVHQTNLTTTIIPSDYTGLTGMSVSSSHPAANSYHDTTSTNYTQWSLSTSTTGYVYYTFDARSIPEGASIVSVTAKAKVRVSNTGRVTNTTCRLYANTTAKGSNVTFASTSASNIATLSPGNSWTRSELNDLRMRIGGTGSSSSSTKAIYFYGAEVTVTYAGTNIYKKVSGSWVKQTNMTTLFELNKSYKRVA